MLLTVYIQLYFLLIFRYLISYDLVFFRDKIKEIDLTRGWLEVGSWLEVDLGSRLARVTLQLAHVQQCSNEIDVLQKAIRNCINFGNPCDAEVVITTFLCSPTIFIKSGEPSSELHIH